ncbi:MAG: hypothetical protein GX200_02635 [Firmicutes bacterium]|nr:hypothetical protein [Bacillota bacterium]
MLEKSKSLAVIILFSAMLGLFSISHALLADAAVSYSERRLLARFPAVTSRDLFSGRLADELEEYLADQFPSRESFRALKAAVQLWLLRQKDKDGLYYADGHLLKLEYPLREHAVLQAADKFRALYDTYLQGMRVYYAIIPDKNYFVAAKNGYPAMDYRRLESLLAGRLQGMKYISLFECLELADYYRTDLHWRQECLLPVVDRLAREMDLPRRLSSVQYEKVALFPFYGAYYGQYGLPLPPEELVYLTNTAIEQATVKYYGQGEPAAVYDTSRFTGVDPYDVFLSGPVPLVEIENKLSFTEKELIMFRDSFGSSLAPLLLAAYRKITLVDLRYMSPALLGKMLDFDRQDVLFLYNTQILNHGEMLK